MKSAMWQDMESTCANQWLFYSPQTNIEKEVMDILTFTTALKKIKYLGINKVKEAKNLYKKKT